MEKQRESFLSLEEVSDSYEGTPSRVSEVFNMKRMLSSQYHLRKPLMKSQIMSKSL